MTLHLQVAARTDVGRVRRHNEDTFIAADLTRGLSSTLPLWEGLLELGDRGLLLAVSDGMGGTKAGEVASALVMSSVAQALASEPAGGPSQVVLAQAVEDAHQTVWSEACARGFPMGATLTAVYVRDTTAYLAEVGDSRAYLIRAGKITQLTKDQSYVQMLVDAGAVAPQDAQGLPMRNVILQAMGNQPKLCVALGRLDLRHLDGLLVCSDGLSMKVTDEELRDAVLSSPDLALGVNRLIDLANERGGEDNATVILAGVSGTLPAPDTREPLEKTYQVLTTFDAPCPTRRHAAVP